MCCQYTAPGSSDKLARCRSLCSSAAAEAVTRVALVVGDDGRARCSWSANDAEYRRYHDEEWGTHAQALLERVLPAHGFRPVAFSRLPYISAGDADADLAFLDDLLVLCRLESNEGGEA